MGQPSSPGWKFGYVPSPGEWSNTFAGKADYPVSVSQGGTGGQDVPTANASLQQRGLISGNTPVALQTLSWYGLKTQASAINLTLPPLASVAPGDWIELLDIDFNAAANNITITASGSDTISIWNNAGTSVLLNISGTRALLIANAGSWSMSTW